MANVSTSEPIEITTQEHALGELSKANLQGAKSLFESNGIIAWRYLWPQESDQDINQETLKVLSGLPKENDFIYVNSRRLLPTELVSNEVKRAAEKLYVQHVH